MFDIAQLKKGSKVQVDRSRDDYLTAEAKEFLQNNYLREEEEFQDLFARVALAYADNSVHAQRLYDYISKLWFVPSPAIFKSGGIKRNLPVLSFLNECADNLYSMADLFSENLWLAARSGEVSSYWGNLSEKEKGIIPFIKAIEGINAAVSNSTSIAYLPVSHPDIEKFIELCDSGIKRGILITDNFMRSVEKDEDWALISPKDGAAVLKLSAKKLWEKILDARVIGQELNLVFVDHVNRALSEAHKLGGLRVKAASGCGEIVLPSGKDNHGQERTATCVTSSLNLEKFEEWENHPNFIEDVMRFLDNAIDDFIKRSEDTMIRSKYSAMRERSVGLGVIGFHSFLQEKGISFEGMMAKVWNKSIFKLIREEVDKASQKLAHEKGACPDAKDYGVMERFSYKLAISATNDEAVIAGASPDVEPLRSNLGNKYLKQLLTEKGQDNEKTWAVIEKNKGSVQALDYLSGEEKELFKTAAELDQSWIVEHAADRTVYICQAQRVDLFVPKGADAKVLQQLHLMAWKRGVKSLGNCVVE